MTRLIAFVLLIVSVSILPAQSVKQFIWKRGADGKAIPYLQDGININLDSAGVYSKSVVDSLIEAATPDTITCITKNSSGTDSTKTNVRWATAAYHKFKIASSGTVITYYIDDVLVATHTTYIDTTPLRFAISHVYNGSGSSEQIYLDYWYLKITGLSR